jgi:tetratricopeptide (TPR) repeat protein
VTAEGWGQLDDYGLLHLAEHLSAARDDAEFREELYSLISAGFMHEKQRRYGSHRAFATDVGLAIDVARSEQPVNLAQEVRGCLLAATLGSLVTPIPPGALELLVRVGDDGRAFELAEMIQDRARQFGAYRTIGETLLERDAVDQALVAARRALDAAQDVAEGSDDSLQGRRAQALRTVVPLLIAVGEADRGREAVNRLERSSVSPAPRNWLAQALAELGEVDRAIRIAEEITDEEVRAEALCGVAAVLVRRGQTPRAIELVRRAELLVQRVFEPVWRVNTLAAAAEVLALAGRRNQAADVRMRSFAGIREISDADRPSAALTGLAHDMARLREPKAAVEIARRLPDGEARVVAMAEVAAGLADTVHPAAVEVAKEALAEVERIGPNWRRRAVLVRLAGALARAGEAETASAVADGMPDWFGRARALAAVGRALAGDDRGSAAALAERALATLLAAGPDEWRHEEEVEVATATFEGLNVSPFESDDWLERDSQEWQPGTLTAVVQRLMDAGASVREESRRASALVEVGLVLAAAGQLDQALEVADEALGGVRVEDFGERSRALQAMAVALGEVGAHDRALVVLEGLGAQERLEEAAASPPVAAATPHRAAVPDPDGPRQQPAPAEAAAALRSGLEAAVRAARSIDDPRARASELAKLSSNLVDAQCDQEALAVMELALQEVAEAPLLVWDGSTLSTLAQALAEAGELESAGRAVAAIKEAGPLAEALAAVAGRHARAGQRELAMAAAERALAMLDEVDAADERGRGLVAVARALVFAGDTRRAMALVAALREDDPTGMWALRARTDLAQALADAGDYRRALELVRVIGEHDGGHALIGVTRSLVRSGRWATLRTSLDEIAKPYWRGRAGCVAVEALAAAGEPRRALALAERIEDEDFAVEGLSVAARALAAGGMKTAAAKVAERALAATDAESATGLAQAAHALATAGKREAALATVKRAQAALRPHDYDSFAVAATMGEVACALAGARQMQRAAGAARRALDAAVAVLAHDLSSPPGQLGALGPSDTEDSWTGPPLRSAAAAVVAAAAVDDVLADHTARTDDDDESAVWLGQQVRLALALALAEQGQVAQAIEVAEGLLEVHDRLWGLSLLTRALVWSGQSDAARLAARRAVAALEESGLAGWRAEVAGQLAAVAARAGDTDRALAVLAEMDDAMWLDHMVPAVARALAERGDADAALAAVARLDEESTRAETLGLVSEALAGAGRLVGAVEVAEQAMAEADEVVDPWARMDLLRRAAGALRQAGHADRALQAAGRAVSTIRDEDVSASQRNAALAAVGVALAGSGAARPGVEAFRASLESARWSSRAAVLAALHDGARDLAALDGGMTLWATCEAATEVEGWWPDG